MASAVRIRWDPGQSPVEFAAGLDGWVARLRAALAEAWRDLADTILSHAQSSHPWSNVTYAAERGLRVDVRWDGDTLILTLYTEAEHGVWLEVRWEGKWGVIVPTLQSHYDEAMRTAAVVVGGR